MFPSQNNSGTLRSPHPRQQPESGGQSSSPIPRKIGNFSTPAAASKGKGFSASISAISTTRDVSSTFPRHRPQQQQQHFSEAKRNTQLLSSPIRRPRNFDFTNANSATHSRKPLGVAEQTKSCPRPTRNVNALQHTKSVPPQKAKHPTVLRTIEPGKANRICLNMARPLACIYVRLLAPNIAAAEAKMEALRKQLSDGEETESGTTRENNGPNVVETTPRRAGRDREGDSSNEFETTLLFSLGVKEVREHKLRAPETVCIGEKCLRKTTNCHRKSQPLFYVPCSGVKARESCSICRCPWTEHMQIGFHLCLSERTVDILAMGKKGGTPLTPHSLNKNNGNRKSAIDKALQNLDTLLRNYRSDVDAVLEFAAKCSIFLCSGNEMENEEDFVRAKFEQELREEELLAELAGKSGTGDSSPSVDFRQRYTMKRKAILEQKQRPPTTTGRASIVDPVEIAEGLEELFQRVSAQTGDLLKKLIRF